VGEGKEILKVLPGLDLQKGVLAKDKIDFRVRIGSSEMANRLDGIGLPFSPNLDVRNAEKGIVGNSPSDHLQPMLAIHQIPCAFVGGDCCRDKNDLGKAQAIPNLFRAPQMALMDGVEGPSEEAHSLLVRIASSYDALPPLKGRPAGRSMDPLGVNLESVLPHKR